MNHALHRPSPALVLIAGLLIAMLAPAARGDDFLNTYKWTPSGGETTLIRGVNRYGQLVPLQRGWNPWFFEDEIRFAGASEYIETTVPHTGTLMFDFTVEGQWGIQINDDPWLGEVTVYWPATRLQRTIDVQYGDRIRFANGWRSIVTLHSVRGTSRLGFEDFNWKADKNGGGFVQLPSPKKGLPLRVTGPEFGTNDRTAVYAKHEYQILSGEAKGNFTAVQQPNWHFGFVTDPFMVGGIDEFISNATQGSFTKALGFSRPLRNRL